MGFENYKFDIYMPYNIGLVGCGNWSKIVTKEIEKHINFNLKVLSVEKETITFLKT